MNAELLNWLVPIANAPVQNFAAYTNLVSNLAGCAEAIPGRPMVADTDPSRRSFFVGDVTGRNPAGPTTTYHGTLDGNGDTIIINRIVAAARALQEERRSGRGNGTPRAGSGRSGRGNNERERAPWRPQVEYQAMVARGVCT